MTTQERLYTIEEFETFLALPENQDRYFELIHGEIVEKVPTQRHAEIGGIITGELYIYTKQNAVGRVYIEARYRIATDVHNARQPDVSFVADRSRPVVGRGAALYMPDLAIDIQSPDDSIRQMRERAHYYLQYGARLVWLIYPAKRIVEVYTANDEQILTEQDTLDGGDVLPGFALPIKAIFS